MSVEIKTILHIQTSKRKSVQKDAVVLEGFHQKYIKVEIDDDGVDHVLDLKWNGFIYEGKFLDWVLTSDYTVTRDFSAKKLKSATGKTPTTAKRRKSGYPRSL